jgi:Sugar-transfer associated ATP-grasp
MLATKIRWVERMCGAAIIAHRCRRKIKRLSRNLPIVEIPGLKADIVMRYSGYSCDLWHKAYAAASGRSCVDYVPEDIFYNVFQDRLNPRNRRIMFRDKNYFDRMNWQSLPRTIFRIINGRLFDQSYQMIDTETALAAARTTGSAEFVVKPARGTSGGHGVAFLDLAALTAFVAAHLKRHSDWIIQQPIIQHEVMSELHPSSVNTMRVVTIRMGAELSVVQVFLRLGVGRSRVDNLSSGNIAVGVDADGRLRKSGYDFGLRRYTAHPDHGYAFDSFVIPSFEEARQTCIALHKGIPDLDLISWDVAIDHRGVPVVIELNVGRQDANLSQICNGPVFGPYVDAVLARHEWLVIPGIGAIDRQADIAPEAGSLVHPVEATAALTPLAPAEAQFPKRKSWSSAPTSSASARSSA